MGRTLGQETLETTSVALRSRDKHRVNSLDLCGTFYQEKVPRHSANKEKRNLIITIASAELGIKEATGNNDGPRVEQYLRYTNLGPGYDWCASFVSWVYAQAGFSAPRNPWSPALFPRARTYKDTDEIQQADLFGIYSSGLKRIHHVGLIRSKQDQYILTIEGNSNNRVESRRRHVKTVYSYADWIK
ncbi:CHAP domain-containing protein [Sphingobacterium sp. C459-1T]|uniref:CHAP domain-containing protein n=2 Tax=Sphingobacterium faecale TaxID=2803775 RepID=A0ABS1R309_9SPHI|nr:CHAP domain-containing protein [Sphingobacterium faecale]